MEVFYFVFLSFIIGVSLYTNFRGRDTSFKLLLSPSLVLGVSFYLYSIALPLSRFFIGSGNVTFPPNMDLDNLYMMHHLIAAIGLLAGFALARYATYYRSSTASVGGGNQYAMRIELFFILSVSLVIFNVYLTIKNIGGIENIFQPYGFNSTEDIFDVSGMAVGSVLEALWIYFALVPLVLFFTIRSSRTARGCAYCLVTVLGFLFLVRGNRNLLGMLLLPLTTIYLLRKVFIQSA